MFIRIILYAFLLISFVGGYAISQGQSNDVEFVYFFGINGKYTKVKAYTNEIVEHGSLLDIKGVHLPKNLRETRISSVRFDKNNSLLYVSVPESGDVSINGTSHYRLIVLKVPTLQLIGNIKLAEATKKPPTLLLTNKGDELIITYELLPHDNQWEFVKETYDTKALQLMKTERKEMAQDSYNPEEIAKFKLSERAHFSRDDTTIIDEEFEMTNDSILLRTPQPIPAVVEQYLKNNSDYLFVNLDEDGRQILLWELKQNQNINGIYYNKYATGKFAIYDSARPTDLQFMQNNELEGEEPKIIAIRPDGKALYFAKGNEHLYKLEFGKDIKLTPIKLFDLSALYIEAVFTTK